MAQRNDLWVWMDVEMTSLEDVRVDKIIEIAAVVTDKDLNIIAEGPDIILHATEADFARVLPEVRTLHEASGLLEDSLKSTTDLQEAESTMLTFLSQYVEPGTAPLCGNSMHMDRMFMKAQMPKLYDFLFYRNIDVSTLKELARRWKPEVYEGWQNMKGHKSHRALDDVKRSIEELQFYREHLLSL